MRWFLLGWSICAIMCSAGNAQAAVVGGNSSSDFLTADLELALLPLVVGGVVVDAELSGLASSSGVSPAPYSENPSAVSINANAGIIPGGSSGDVLDVTSSAVTPSVSSNVDGLSGIRFANSSHSIANLDLSVVELASADLISITAVAINVTSAVNGEFGSLDSVGTMNVEDLVIRVGNSVVATLDGTIAPNTGINLSVSSGGLPLDIEGASLILNEQVTTGDGTSSLGLATNAISLRFIETEVTGVGELNGSVLVGQTTAGLQASAVPEPSSLALLGVVGFGGAFWRGRRKVAGLASQV